MVKTISKDEISKFPLATFKGRIITIQSKEEAIKAVDYLNEYQALGFDTETRPAFRKGQTNKISLMQVSTDDTCFLFRLNLIDIPDCLDNILINPEIKKIGLSLKDDFSAIRKRKDLKLDGFIELQSYVKKFGIEDSSLQRIYAILFAEKISKGQRLTNWDATILTEAQQKYAALDAWACLRIYEKLKKLDLTL